jgi:hypothetical protein
VFNKSKVLTGLIQWGWTTAHTIDESKLIDIAKAYCGFHGLGSVEELEQHIQQPRFCNHPDVMPLGERLCKWPTNKITWSILDPLPGTTLSELEDVFGKALDAWQRVCALRATYSMGNDQANIVISHRRIDGPLGTLAESELPCGNNPRQCRQWYDNGDKWSYRLQPSRGYTSLLITGTHELGHAIGISHIGKGNIMQPMYDVTISVPQAGDIAEAQARYPGNTDPDPIPLKQVILLFEGDLSGGKYKLVKAA